MILVNLRRMSECSLCERQTPVENPTTNAKQNGDESDQAQLCPRCMGTCKAWARFERSLREEEEYARD